MPNNEESSQAAGAAKSARNRRDYAKSKAEREHVLLRLDKGGMSTMDAAASAAGLSRAAFARMFLPAILGPMGSRLARIEAARTITGKSLARFLESAIDEAIEAAHSSKPETAALADEFDELFG